jgi:CBS domain containing-hemolysin-like protein
MLGSKLEEEGIDTIGGLIFNRLGALPKPGAEMKIDGLTLTVRRTSRKRIEEVLIVQDAPSELEQEDES